MKKNITLLLSTLIMLFSSCSDDNEISARDQQINFLTNGAWITQSVQHATDGDLMFQYTDFSITFINNPASGFDGDYIVVNGGYAFHESNGKWKFNDDLTKINFANGQELTSTVSDTQLTLNFTVAASGGRVNGLSGQFTFVLKH